MLLNPTQELDYNEFICFVLAKLKSMTVFDN